MTPSSLSNAKERRFPKARVALNDTQVMTTSGDYNLSSISYAEVVTRRHPVEWRTFIQVQSSLFLFFAALWAITASFGWVAVAGPSLALFWLLHTVSVARIEVKKSYKHTLVLETRAGPVEAVTSDDDQPLLEACEAINNNIKHAALQPLHHQIGEPTRRIMSS